MEAACSNKAIAKRRSNIGLRKREIITRIEQLSDNVTDLVSKRKSLILLVKKLKDRRIEECIRDRIVDFDDAASR